MKAENLFKEEKEMKIELTNEVILTGAPLEVSRSLQRKLTVWNPEFMEAQWDGRNRRFIPEHLEFFKKNDNRIFCPRGTAGMVSEVCSAYAGKKIFVHDNRHTLTPINFTFQGELGPIQQKDADLISKETMGVWEAPTETDRIIMAMYLAWLRKQRTLIVVETEEWLKKWVDHIGYLLEIKPADVGIINYDQCRVGEKITVALVEEILHDQVEVGLDIGHLILDKRSDISTMKHYLDVIQLFGCKYQLWLTSSSPEWGYFDDVVELFAGPIIEKIEKQKLLPYGNLCQGNAFFIPIGYSDFDFLSNDPPENYSDALTEMTQGQYRNRIVVETVMKYRDYDLTLILSERQQHCESLAKILKQEQGIDAAVLTGDTPAKKRLKIIQDLRSGKYSFLVATNQLIEKGFDLPEIGTLALATPIKFSGRHFQYIGRALRKNPRLHKTLILNFVDDYNYSGFTSLARSNWETYKQHGFTVIGSVENIRQISIFY
jgi:superfamily II DNA or RNA helicase